MKIENVNEEAIELNRVQGLYSEISYFFENTRYFTISQNTTWIFINPVCKFLEIDYSYQEKILLRNPVFKDHVKYLAHTGKDKKSYKMFCLSKKYFLKWLINTNSSSAKFKYYRDAFFQALLENLEAEDWLF